MPVLTFLGGVVGWVAAQTGLLGILPHGVQTVIAVVSGALGVLGIRQATPQSSVAVALDKLGSGWKTVVGAVVAAIGYSLDPAVQAGLPPGLARVLQVVGVVLAALGLYHAQARKVTG